MVTFYKDFLTEEECQVFIELIEQNKFRSTVLEPEGDKATASPFRTSSTAGLNSALESVAKLHTRISEVVDRPLERGEPLQGQVYEPEQYFKPHTDYFEPAAYNQYCLASGNREITFMIYLNDVEEGGETIFPNLNYAVRPQKGTAISWYNMKDGKTTFDSLHEGSPVKQGVKYVITSWWRENKFDPQKDHQLFLDTLKE